MSSTLRMGPCLPFLGLTALALAACTCEPFGIDTVRYQCAKDKDCGAGMRCAQGQCTALDAGSSTGGGDATDGGSDAGGGGTTGGGTASGGGEATGGGSPTGGGSGTGGGGQCGVPEICGNGVDDDCDLAIDCADTNCNRRSCGANGRLCVDSSCTCSSDAGVVQAFESVCDDGVDNDCNGLRDCEEAACALHACSTTGHFCAADGGCRCTGNGGMVELTETRCDDGFDNDCNGTADCADSRCNSRACDATLPMTCQGSRCACAPDSGTAGGPEVNCANNKDDNCNGLVDCAEASCDGQPCSTTGRVCIGGACTCQVPGGTVQSAETICDDGKDNDCDDLVDCREAACSGQDCGANSFKCAGSSCVCSGGGGVAQPLETNCSDNFDNDCDTFVDCAQASCNGRPCSTTGKVCAGTFCACSGNGGVVQASETLCTDGKDNDCDGVTDCADADCAGLSCGGPGKTCVANVCTCDGRGGTPELSETTLCSDTFDNDCDGTIDCADSSCNTLSCGAHGLVCLNGQCRCGGGGGAVQTAETTCGDGADNDCDGLVDCADSNCVSRFCSNNGVCCPGRGCVNTSTTNDCGGCGLTCAPGASCVIRNGALRAYACSCSAVMTTCPTAATAQVCSPSLAMCSCDPSGGLQSTQCAPGMTCSSSKLCVNPQ